MGFNKCTYGGMILGAVLGTIVGVILDQKGEQNQGYSEALPSGSVNISNQSQVAQGYINPKNLEFKLKDLTGDGEKETILKIKGTNYLFRMIDGNPVLQKYTVKPAKIIQGQIIPKY